MPQTVREIMTRNLVTVRESDSVVDAAKAMRDSDIGDVVVVGSDSISGIVTDRDIVVRAIADGRDPSTISVGEISSRDVTTVSPDEDAGRAVQLMRQKAIRRLPVVEDGRPVGFLSIGDLAMERDEDSALADISEAPANR